MGAYLDQHPLAFLGWLALGCLAAGAVAVLGFLAAAPIAAARRERHATRNQQPKGDQ